MAFIHTRYHPPGTSPGTLTEGREKDEPELRLSLFDYGGGELTEIRDASAEACLPYIEKGGQTWVHVRGRATGEQMRALGAAFRLHPLVMEDVQNTAHRPKVEPFDDQLFIVMALPLMDGGELKIEQVSLLLSGTTVLSFCEADKDPFEPIVKRLQERSSRLRSKGADYLLYSLLDAVIDQAFPVLEEFGLALEDLEESILESPSNETLQQIHQVRRELIMLRRMLWPQREVINHLLRDEEKLIERDTRLYLRDCYDHTIQVMDLMESYRDMAASMLEIYLSSVSNRMNDVMRVLTVIATIFIPLTFISGIYGMNFDREAGWFNMPELGWPFGYLFALGLMTLVAVGMILFFRRRGWF